MSSPPSMVWHCLCSRMWSTRRKKWPRRQIRKSQTDTVLVREHQCGLNVNTKVFANPVTSHNTHVTFADKLQLVLLLSLPHDFQDSQNFRSMLELRCYQVPTLFSISISLASCSCPAFLCLLIMYTLPFCVSSCISDIPD